MIMRHSTVIALVSGFLFALAVKAEGEGAEPEGMKFVTVSNYEITEDMDRSQLNAYMMGAYAMWIRSTALELMLEAQRSDKVLSLEDATRLAVICTEKTLPEDLARRLVMVHGAGKKDDRSAVQTIDDSLDTGCQSNMNHADR